LNALRGIAALAVVLFHIELYSHLLSHLEFVGRLYLMVDLFFVLIHLLTLPYLAALISCRYLSDPAGWPPEFSVRYSPAAGALDHRIPQRRVDASPYAGRRSVHDRHPG
jgi:hypothetical protein